MAIRAILNCLDCGLMVERSDNCHMAPHQDREALVAPCGISW